MVRLWCLRLCRCLCRHRILRSLHSSNRAVVIICYLRAIFLHAPARRTRIPIAIRPVGETSPPVRTKKQKRKAFIGAIAGHLIEWYDYGVYGFVAVYVGTAFFAASTPAIALLSSFATFALSFFMRPLGGLVF